MLAFLVACTTSTPQPPAAATDDPCCSLALAGDPVWERCDDETVRKVMCHQMRSCCTEQWGPDCVLGYREYAPTCPTRRSQRRSDGGTPDADPAAEPVPTARARVTLVVDAEPPPSELFGGTVFYGGFREVEAHSGRPAPGQAPDDHGVLVLRTTTFPVQDELELIPGLYYFAVYGGGPFPESGDRMSATALLEPGAARLELLIDDSRIPD